MRFINEDNIVTIAIVLISLIGIGLYLILN